MFIKISLSSLRRLAVGLAAWAQCLVFGALMHAHMRACVFILHTFAVLTISQWNLTLVKHMRFTIKYALKFSIFILILLSVVVCSVLLLISCQFLLCQKLMEVQGCWLEDLSYIYITIYLFIYPSIHLCFFFLHVYVHILVWQSGGEYKDIGRSGRFVFVFVWFLR